MIFLNKHFIRLVLVCTISLPSYAQVCIEPTVGETGKANLICDMTYRNTVVTCDTVSGATTLGTNPSCPKRAMPMITTPKASYVADYTDLLFTVPHDAKDGTIPYNGTYSIGTSGDASSTFQMFGKGTTGGKQLAACKTQLSLPSLYTTDAKGIKHFNSAKDEARFNRLQIDNCTNQYILNTALYPYQKENPSLLSLENPADPSEFVSLKTSCQPLSIKQEKDNEYSASEYLKTAWIKMLIDPGYRKSTPGYLKGAPCSILDTPCDHEPHLPVGTTIADADKIPLPDPFPEVLLSSISTVPYEEIVDPTHPFSPRWDYRLNDRDYSNPSFGSVFSSPPSELANAALIYAQSYVYMTDVKDSIFCAGEKKADRETDEKKKKDLEVKVDVLAFRRPAFESALLRRTNYNAVCYEHEDPFDTLYDFAGLAATFVSYCYNVMWTGNIYNPPYFKFTFKKCWDCYGLSGQSNGESNKQPCTTNYLGHDMKMKSVLPGGLNMFSRTAQCNYFLQSRDSKYDMDKVCRDLRKPFTPLNKLKMRYHNPDDDNDRNGKNIALKDGALEGMTFKEYFGDHMPYPKILDTGNSLRKTPSGDASDQPPLDTTGQYTAIVGVGREAAAEAAAQGGPRGDDGLTPKERYTDQRCKIGGWGGIRGVPLPLGSDFIRFGGVNFVLPDPVTSWTDMKLYQTRTLRTAGMSCLGRYEKVFKPGSAENMVLLATGADWSKLIVTKCTRTPDGKTSDCKNMSLKEYNEMTGSKTSSDTTLYMKDLSLQGWPNSWRGYMAAGGLLDVANTNENAFPNFGGGLPAGVPGSLDSAKKRDIIIMPFGPKNDMVKPGLAKLALVTETRLPSETNCETEKNCYIKVLEPDNGKWPDICGTTDTWGQMKSRYYYKPGHLPPETKAEYIRIGTTSNCSETRISQCEQTAWSGASGLRIYHIDTDMRLGCTKEKASECKKD